MKLSLVGLAAALVALAVYAQPIAAQDGDNGGGENDQGGGGDNQGGQRFLRHLTEEQPAMNSALYPDEAFEDRYDRRDYRRYDRRDDRRDYRRYDRRGDRRDYRRDRRYGEAVEDGALESLDEQGRDDWN